MYKVINELPELNAIDTNVTRLAKDMAKRMDKYISEEIVRLASDFLKEELNPVTLADYIDITNRVKDNGYEFKMGREKTMNEDVLKVRSRLKLVKLGAD